MCTAFGIKGAHHVFGRTLDLECSYGEQIAITPKKAPLRFVRVRELREHVPLIGVACVREGVALYYDAISAAGLAMAALRFPESAVYHAPRKGCYNVASFELIPFILGRAKTMEEALALLADVNVTKDAFSCELPPSPLHWLLTDGARSFAVESVAEGLVLHENPFHVLTNEPPFPYHMARARELLHLSPDMPQNSFAPMLSLSPLSRGVGAVGLPGDFSSGSRFLRAAFAMSHTESGTSEREEVERFFHVAGTVNVPLGCVRTEDGRSVCSVYTACGCTDTRTYYTCTYGRRELRAVTLDGIPDTERAVITFPL
jgi:choloylglycine hydrolase